MARTHIAPIVTTENAALTVRKGAVTAAKIAKAGGILGFCFIRTLVTGNVTEEPTAQQVANKSVRRTRRSTK